MTTLERTYRVEKNFSTIIKCCKFIGFLAKCSNFRNFFKKYIFFKHFCKMILFVNFKHIFVNLYIMFVRQM